MRRTTTRVLILVTILILVVPSAADAAAARNWHRDFAAADLRGTDDGLDFMSVRINEYREKAFVERYLYLEICDVEAGPLPPGHDVRPAECWYTGFDPVQHLDVDKLTLAPSSLEFHGSVMMFCSYPSTCAGEAARLVDVSLEWIVDQSTFTHAEIDLPFPDLKVKRNTWTFDLSGVSVSIEGLPIDPEPMAPTRLDAELEHTFEVTTG